MKKRDRLTMWSIYLRPLFFFLFIPYDTFSQVDANRLVRLGSPFPDYNFNEIEYYGSKSATIKDFRGKWLILDFWGEYCKGCIASFPKMSEFQKKFKDKIQILSVAVPYKNPANIRRLFERCKEEKDLDLSVAYDSILAQKINVRYYPDIIIIDPEGIVVGRYSTINEDVISNMISGEKIDIPWFDDSVAANSHSYNYNMPYLIKGNGGDDMSYLYRSVISRPSANTPNINLISNGRLEVLRSPLLALYRLAFFGVTDWTNIDSKRYGKINQNLVLTIKDSSLFDVSGLKENSFCYSLSHPSIPMLTANLTTLEDYPNLMNILQRDLLNCFPFDAKVVNSPTSIKKIVCTESARQKVIRNGIASYRGAVSVKKNARVSFSGTVDDLISVLSHSIGAPSNMLFVNETNITGVIKINLESVYYDSMVRELEKNGITLLDDKKDMLNLIISDR